MTNIVSDDRFANLEDSEAEILRKLESFIGKLFKRRLNSANDLHVFIPDSKLSFFASKDFSTRQLHIQNLQINGENFESNEKGNPLEQLIEIIKDLPELKDLKLAHNQIDIMPDSISRLKYLKKLDLAHNKLTALPDSISSLKFLRDLDLAHNILTALPETMQEMSLFNLYINDNQFSEFPRQIYKMGLDESETEILKKLEQIIGEPFQRFFISDYQHRSGLYFLIKNTSMREIQIHIAGLQISCKNLSAEENEKTHNFDKLIQFIKKLSQLKELNLSNNQITIIPDSFAELAELEMFNELNLMYNKIARLPSSFKELNLAKLQLDHNQFSEFPWEVYRNGLEFCSLGANPLPDFYYKYVLYGDDDSDEPTDWRHEIEPRLEALLNHLPVLLNKITENLPLDDYDRAYPEYQKYRVRLEVHCHDHPTETAQEMLELLKKVGYLEQEYRTPPVWL